MIMSMFLQKRSQICLYLIFLHDKNAQYMARFNVIFFCKVIPLPIVKLFI